MVAEAQADRSEGQHASVFISYAREDIDFVRLLDAALRKRNRESWVDLEDIKPTEEWLASVFSGIEGANAFVFVISPESVESKSCLQELAHAVEHNKRLVPIVCREVDASTVPEPLRSPQWIFFRDGDDFEEAFQDLVDALDTDLDWVHAHTRLLMRAIEWDSNGRDNSFVLRGSDLQTAEEWQARAADKEPKLSTLQTEYILAGRRAATRRQRLTLGAVTLGLIVAAILALLFLYQRNQAIRQSNIALGRQLAAQAQLAETQGPLFLQQSVLFAAEAEKQSPLHSPEAEKILRQGLGLLPRQVAALTYEDEPDMTEYDYGGTSTRGKVVFSPDDKYMVATNSGNTARIWYAHGDHDAATVTQKGIISDIVFSPTGRYFSTAGNTARVWDASTGEEISRMKHGDDEVGHITFSPDGKYLATSTFTGKDVRVWDVESGNEVTGLKHDEYVLGIAFSPDGKHLATATSQAVHLWDPSSGEEVASLGYDDGSPTSLVFSPDGKYLAAASGINTGGKTARVWEVASRKQVTLVSHEGSILDVEFSPDSKYFATASDDKTARVWKVASGKELVRVSHADLVASVAFSPDGRYLTTASYDNTARVWDLFTGGEEVTRMIHGDKVKEAVFSPDGMYVATASDDNTARVWNPASSSEFAEMLHRGVHTFAFNREGSYLATAGWDGIARVWNLSRGKEVAHMTHGANIMAVAFSPDGRYLATAGVDNTARVWDVSNGEEIARLEHQWTVDDLMFSPNGEYLATGSSDNTVRLWKPDNGKEVARFIFGDIETSAPSQVGTELLQTGSTRVEFSPNGKYLAAANRLANGGNTARVWHVTTRKEVARMSHQGSIDDIAFSPDSKYLATASEDKTVRVWEIASGSEVARMAHDAGVLDLAFSPDGKRLATASTDETARVWEIADGEEVTHMIHEGLVYSVSFSHGGKYLVTASIDNTARVWYVTSGSEVARVDNGPFDSILDAGFAPGGKYLVTVGSNSTRAWLWRRPQDLVDDACTRMTRNFTRDEWQQNVPEEPYRKTCPNLPELE
jgi:WD40 repeat protein